MLFNRALGSQPVRIKKAANSPQTIKTPILGMIIALKKPLISWILTRSALSDNFTLLFFFHRPFQH